MYLVCRGMRVPVLLLYDGNIESGNSTVVVVGPRTLSYGSSFWYRLFIFRRYLFYHQAHTICIKILPALYDFLSMAVKKMSGNK